MPTVQQTKDVLDYIAEKPDDPKSIQAIRKLGISPVAAAAWKESQSLPEDDPKRVQVRNKIYDQISNTVAPSQEGGGGTDFMDRAVVKNLIDRDPVLQQKFLEKKGYITKHTPEGLLVRKPDSPVFQPVDPEGFDRFDIFDIASDIGEAIVTGAATGAKALGLVGAPVTAGGSLAATAALGGTATAGYEAAKQGVAMAFGAREDLNKGRIAQAGLLGAAVPVAFKGGGKILKKGGDAMRSLTEKLNPLKQNADDIIRASEAIGAKATPGQLFASEGIQKGESALNQSSLKLGGIGLRKQIVKNKKAAEQTARNILDSTSGITQFESGQRVKKLAEKEMADVLAPAEAIYEQYETIFKRGAYKINPTEVTSIVKNISDDVSKFSPSAKSKLRSLKSLADNVRNLDDLKKFRTTVRNEFSPTDTPEVKKALTELYGSLTDFRSQKLLDNARQYGGDIFEQAQKDITSADAIYKQASQSVREVFANRGQNVVGSPKQVLKRFFEKTPEAQTVNKILNTQDPAKIEAARKYFPETFEALKEAKMQDIFEKSMKDGQIIPAKMVRAIGKMEPESKVLIFGDEAAAKIDALETYLESLPPMLGPSGTPQGLEFLKMFSFWSQASSVGRQKVQDLLTNPQLQKDAATRFGQWLQKPAATAAGEFTARQILPAPTNENNRFQIPQQRTILPPMK